LDRTELNRPRDEPHGRGRATGQGEVPLGRRRELLKRVARGEDEPAYPLGVVPDEPLRHRAAGVVGHDGNVVEAERFEQGGDDAGDAGKGEVGVLPHRVRVRPQREVGDDAAVLAGEPRDHSAPQVAVDTYAVHENDRRARAALAVCELARRQIDGSLLSEERAG